MKDINEYIKNEINGNFATISGKSFNEYTSDDFLNFYNLAKTVEDKKTHIAFIFNSLLKTNRFTDEFSWILEKMEELQVAVSYNNIILFMPSSLTEREKVEAILLSYFNRIEEDTFKDGKNLVLKENLEKQNKQILDFVKKNDTSNKKYLIYKELDFSEEGKLIKIKFNEEEYNLNYYLDWGGFPQISLYKPSSKGNITITGEEMFNSLKLERIE